MSGAAAGTVSEALSSAADAFAAAGVDSPRLDAELLLAAATGSERARLIADREAPVSGEQGRVFGAFVRRRIQREPVAYILGHKGFRRIELEVDRRVLIPRPETELLVEIALELAPLSVADVGTGSGAVALAIADELPEAHVLASDASLDALVVAKANCDRLGLADRVSFANLAGLPEGAFGLLVSNLPYVAEAEWGGLAAEITRYEPREALVSGPTGFEAIEALLGDLALRAPGARPPAVALEVGDGQAATAAELLRRAGYEGVELRADLAGIERVVFGREAAA